MLHDSLETYIEKLLSEDINMRSLQEAEMSAEDAYETELLRSIIDKTRERSNARLTPEEKAVLAKYGLTREGKAVTIPGEIRYYRTSDEDISNPRGGNRPERRSGYYSDPYNHDPSKVNLADIARKRGARFKARRDAILGDKLNTWADDRYRLKLLIDHRDYLQKQIEEADSKYLEAIEKAKEEFNKAIERAEAARERIDTQLTPELTRVLAEIEALTTR